MAANSSAFATPGASKLAFFALGAAAFGTLQFGASYLCKRLAKPADDEQDNVYETSKSLNEYLAMHFAHDEDFPASSLTIGEALRFPTRCAEKCHEHTKTAGWLPSRALDVGCAVGRSTFELARFYTEVVGIDFSQSFIDAAKRLQVSGSAEFTIQIEGDIRESRQATIDSEIDRTRVRFEQGDACALPDRLGQFGVVMAANLVCRVPKPRLFLERLSSLVVAGGFVVMPSPYTWLEEFTPKTEWVGAHWQNDADGVTPLRSFAELQRILLPDFELVEECDMPFIIRETARKNQLTLSHLTVWKRRSAE